MINVDQLNNNLEELRRNFKPVSEKTEQSLRIYTKLRERKADLYLRIDINNKDWIKSYRNVHDREMKLMQIIINRMDTGRQIIEEVNREIFPLQHVELLRKNLNAVKLVFEITRNYWGQITMRLAHEEKFLKEPSAETLKGAEELFYNEAKAMEDLSQQLQKYNVRASLKFFQKLRQDADKVSKELTKDQILLQIRTIEALKRAFEYTFLGLVFGTATFASVGAEGTSVSSAELVKMAAFGAVIGGISFFIVGFLTKFYNFTEKFAETAENLNLKPKTHRTK